MSKQGSIIPGQQYVYWTVLADAGWIGSNHCYLCRCVCGKEKTVSGSSLKSGDSKNCGCRRNNAKTNGRDLTGQTFGYWQVLSPAGRNQRGAKQYLCRCVCGTERVVVEADLLNGHSKSCGCRRCESRYNGLDLTGRMFCKWHVLAPTERDKRGRKQYLCRCVCGTERVVVESALLNGHSKSCGCSRVELWRLSYQHSQDSDPGAPAKITAKK